jgi:glycine cleavage system H lipoate-binding protein/TusA-related sulfurtransferase
MDVEGCALPEDRLYDLEQDVWFLWDDDRRSARVGVLASLAAFAGRVHNVEFRPVAGPIDRGRSLGLIESVRYTGAVRTPVKAIVLERNEALRARPKLVNDSPYERGWFCRVAPVEPDLVGTALRPASEVQEELAAKVRLMRIRCFPAAPDVELYEIGAECQAILARVDETLRERPPDDVLLLVTDDPTSPIEMTRWSQRTGHQVLHHRVEGNLHQFLIRKEGRPHPAPRRPGGPEEHPPA